MAQQLNDSGMMHLKALVTGASGTGKSSMGATAPRPLILLSERQGEVSIRARARALGLEQPTILFMETLDDYRAVARALVGDRDKPFRVLDPAGTPILEMEAWPETVVIDSLTDACELVWESVQKDSPPKRGEDGLPVLTQRHWGELRTRCSRLIRLFRDIPCHVLFLCLLDERVTETSDGTSTRTVGPLLPMRALPDIAMAATNVAGILTRRSAKDPDNPEGDRIFTWEVITVGPPWMKVKPFRPLRDAEAPDFGAWVDVALGRMEGEAIEAQAAGEVA